MKTSNECLREEINNLIKKSNELKKSLEKQQEHEKKATKHLILVNEIIIKIIRKELIKRETEEILNVFKKE